MAGACVLGVFGFEFGILCVSVILARGNPALRLNAVLLKVCNTFRIHVLFGPSVKDVPDRGLAIIRNLVGSVIQLDFLVDGINVLRKDPQLLAEVKVDVNFPFALEKGINGRQSQRNGIIILIGGGDRTLVFFDGCGGQYHVSEVVGCLA